MKEFNIAGLREALEQHPTDQLDAMLRAELEKEPPDEHAVKMLLKVLREREADYPVESSEQIDRALERYRKPPKLAKPRLGSTLLRVASILLVVGALMLMLPKEANARNFFDRIASWTDSIFELFSPSDSGRQRSVYEFKTDHPGLQAVYDAVTELGVTVPVVPMWLDEHYILAECKVTISVGKNSVYARFMDGDLRATFQLDVYAENVAHEFHKDNGAITEYEKNGTIYNIMQNKDMYVVVWAIENIECAIGIDCQEDTIYKILDSIYAMEE